MKLNLLNYMRTGTKNMITVNASFLFSGKMPFFGLILHPVLAFWAL